MIVPMPFHSPFARGATRISAVHLKSAVSTTADKASSSEERSRAVGSESWARSVKASAVNSHHYKRQFVR